MKNLLLLMLGLSLAITGCQSDKGNKDDKDNTGKKEKKGNVSTDIIDNPGKAKFEFEKETHDFGEITQGEKVEYTFRFTNTGKKPLVISDANPSCGCTVPNYPKEAIKPGESGFIDVVFDSEGESGNMKKSVTLRSNAEGGVKKLYIKGTIKTKQ